MIDLLLKARILLFMPDTAEVAKNDILFDPSFDEMVAAGVFYGRKKTKTNPKMKSVILTNRGGIEVIDLHVTRDALSRVIEVLKEKVKSGGQVLFVGTHPPASSIQRFLDEFGYPVVVRRWVGGTLTNFGTISKRIEHLKNLKSDLASGALDKYTKKERLLKEREITRLTDLLGGLEQMTKLPDLMVVVDPMMHTTAMREARRAKIPVIVFANTDADPDAAEYVVPGNSIARKSVEWFLSKLAEAIQEAKQEANAEPTATAEATSET
jgi:small subunit ribosomal protein S2